MTTEARRWAVVVATLFAATAALTGCGESGGATASPTQTAAPTQTAPTQTAAPTPTAARWREPTRYTYVLDSTCGERALIGRFRITVEKGKVTKAEGLDDSAKRALETTKSEPPPTLRQLLDELDRARQAGADVAELTTDATDGHPTKITIDPAANSIDDESCYAITEFTA
jgi:hypothetical protein